MEALEVGINHAVELIAAADARRKGPRKGAQLTILREVGKHPEDGEAINVIDGRYGPYLKHGATNAPLPRGVETDDVTMEQAVEAIASRAKRSEEHTSELQSLMRIWYAVFCLKKKKQ